MSSRFVSLFAFNEQKQPNTCCLKLAFITAVTYRSTISLPFIYIKIRTKFS